VGVHTVVHPGGEAGSVAKGAGAPVSGWCARNHWRLFTWCVCVSLFLCLSLCLRL
jgi:hypothetical protein